MNNPWADDPNRAEGAHRPVPGPWYNFPVTERKAPRINRRELIIAVILFLATVSTTVIHGTILARNFAEGGQAYFNPLQIPQEIWQDPSLLWLGVPFSAALLLILLSHEMGHYIACRYYRMNATPPYFLPVPIISLVGTLGAFIRIRSPFESRRALFDVGVAGPIAGFVVLIPALIYGIQHSTVVPITTSEALLSFDNFGQPLIFRWLWQLLQSPYSPATHTINLHPVGWAAWFGLFATCLNLLPIGQLDGGHVTYALLGARGHRWTSLSALGGLGALSIWAVRGSSVPVPPYLVFTIVLLIIGLRHPQTLNDGESLSASRNYIGLLALLIFLCSFIPIPIMLN